MRPDVSRTWLVVGAIGPLVSVAVAGVLAFGGHPVLAGLFVLVGVIYVALLVIVGRAVSRSIAAADAATRAAASVRPERVAPSAPKAPELADASLLATMSHEIRTPLSAIMSLLELGRESRDPEARSEYAGLTEDAARHLMQVVDDVLDLSRIQAGQVQLEVAPVDVESLIADVVDRARVRADARGLRVQWTGNVGPEIRSLDAERLGQALFNLLVHAINVTREGWVGLQVAAVGERVTFEVHAGGVVDPDQATVGLGPAIVEGVLKLCGGELVTATDPHGSQTWRFEVDLPIVGERSDEREPSLSISLRPLRLLVAEDNPVNQLIIRRALEGMHHDVDVVGSGEQALERAHLGYDAVLMDFRMPGLDGAETARAIRARERVLGRPRVPIVALSASAYPEQRDACLAAGMDAWMTKPLDRRRLTKILATLVTDEREGSTRPGH